MLSQYRADYRIVGQNDALNRVPGFSQPGNEGERPDIRD
jgi:hypothetical protein